MAPKIKIGINGTSKTPFFTTLLDFCVKFAQPLNFLTIDKEMCALSFGNIKSQRKFY